MQLEERIESNLLLPILNYLLLSTLLYFIFFFIFLCEKKDHIIYYIFSLVRKKSFDSVCKLTRLLMKKKIIDFCLIFI